MKRETLETFEKPLPMLLPSTRHRASACSKHFSFKEKEKSLQEKAVHKFTARYDAFQGILKRVSEMKLNGSLDSEEPSTCSEKSDSSKWRRPKEQGGSSMDNRSSASASAFDDESSCSSITGSDQCPPYEEIQRLSCCNRYSCSSLPAYPAYAETALSSLGENLPPPPSPTEFYENFSSQSALTGHKAREPVGSRDSPESRRPRSVLGANERESLVPLCLAADVNDNCTSLHERTFTVDEGRHPQDISETEKHQLELFFKSLKTDVFVCGTLANLYFGWKQGEGNWSYRHTGLVVVLFDSGETRSRNKRKIQILLAERGTCFPLWKDTIDNLSAYHKSGAAFHTMYLSYDHRQMAGLSFNSSTEAERLLRHLEELTSNPENINISAPGSKKKKKGVPKKKLPPLPQKKHISNPCLFQHVTTVSARDKLIYMSLQTLLDNEIIKKKENIC